MSWFGVFNIQNTQLIFSPEAKRLGSSIAFSANWSFAFFVTYFEPDIEVALKTSGAYFLFSAICIFGKMMFYLLSNFADMQTWNPKN